MSKIKLKNESITFKVSKDLQQAIKKEKESLQKQGSNCDIFNSICSLADWWYFEKIRSALFEEIEHLLFTIRTTFKIKKSSEFNIILISK